MKETLFRRLLPIMLIVLCLTFVKILALEIALLVFLVYYVYRLIRYLWERNKKRSKLCMSKALKNEFYMLAYSFTMFIIPLWLITHAYGPWFVWACFLFGLFMIFTTCKHMLRYNKKEIFYFQKQLEGRIALWVLDKLSGTGRKE